MIDVVGMLCEELRLKESQVKNALQLRGEGGTVPFIARYRKERTGGMTELQLRALFDRHGYLRELEERKRTVLKSIEEQGKLTTELRSRIELCVQKAALEDLYLPFRPKRRTRATAAREHGLEPLALFIAGSNRADVASVDLEGEATKYMSPEHGIATAQEALAGASDILAEDVAQNAEHRGYLRELFLKEGVIVSSVREDLAPGTTKYEMYRQYKVKVKELHPHNLLALMRGEREGKVRFDITINDEVGLKYLETKELFAAAPSVRAFYAAMLRDAYERLLRPSIVLEVRTLRKERADRESIKTFEGNLRDLLLASPAGMKPTLGVDPGLRTGCKVAVIDATGKLVEHHTIFPHQGEQQRTEAAALLTDVISRNAIELIAIGNGTAGRETDEFISSVIAATERKPVKVIVNEAGASVYSASPAAVEEFPGLDVTVRGAVSIGRRLQDPLAELVKIDPKAIGVGQYQHDVDQKLLRKQLAETVESCVNFVGVELNTASNELLRYVAGINSAIARSIVAHRNEKGPFTSREQLRGVPKMGPKAFEQAAGFLRIRGAEDPLDNTGVHPESYPVARRIISDLGIPFADIPSRPDLLNGIDLKKYVTETVGEPTLCDIVSEIQRPGRDPRTEFKYAKFREDVKEIKDLKPGMELEGVVTNVANFGAFVDVGVHHDGLVHVSQLADRFVADPKMVVHVGQIVKVRILEVNEALKRISLTMKSPGGGRPKQRPKQGKKPHPKTPKGFTLDDLKAKFNNR